jgi:type IV pilus assembly protein PilB
MAHMHSEKKNKNIGEILHELGRVSQEDIDRAVEHQRQEGGFFGQALVALGVVQQEELEWGLASQFNLPYIFPEASAVDPEVAGLVSSDWALSHTALPIARADDRITLVVHSPLQTAPAEELEERTGLDVELALASAGNIRQVIRQVFSRDRLGPDPLAAGEAVSLDELRTLAQLNQARRWGVSVRDGRALGWYEEGDEVRRFRLRADWEAVLERILSPSPGERLPARGEGDWLAQLRQGGRSSVVAVRGISTAMGYELLITPSDTNARAPSVPEPPEDVIQEVRLLLGEGPLVLGIRGNPSGVALELLPILPAQLLPPGHRSLYLMAREGPSPSAGEILTLPLEGPEAVTERRLRELREFRFDAVALSLDPEATTVHSSALKLAPFTLILLPTPKGDDQEVTVPGVDWVLDVHREDEDEWRWTLTRTRGEEVQ